MIGEVIGSYRVMSELGKGGMGVLYRAQHVQLGRPAALKMLLPQLASDASIVQRFFNEAKAAAAIDHPGIVEIYDFGHHTDGSAYIVMELLRGETLLERLRRGPITVTEGASLIAQVAGTLAAAHAQDIVHRDLKPDNIFLTPNDMIPGGLQVKLLDFGIAKLADDSTGLKTQTGALIGTPAYMSPEQCMGKADLDHRTDLYSLGCILFHVLCGRPPFLSEHGSGVLIAAHMRDPAPHPRTLVPDLPEALEVIVLRLLEKEPAARFGSAAELRAALVSAGADAPSTQVLDAQTQFAPTLVPRSGATAAAAAPAATAPPPTTTRSGAASELVAAAAPAPRGGVQARWVALGGALVAAGGVAAFLLVRSSRDAGARAATLPDAAPVAAIAMHPVRDAAPAPPPDATPAPPPDAVPAPPTLPDAAPAADALLPFAEVDAAAAGSATAATDAAAAAAGGETPLADQRFTLAAATVAPGAPVVVTFATALHAAVGERFWITVLPHDQPDSGWGRYSYLGDGDARIELVAPALAGRYEVRLHGRYPTLSTHVVHREALLVE